MDADRNAIVVGPERKDSADDIAYIAAWHPGVALAALDVIEAAEAWSNAEIPHPNEDHALLDALVAWDALTGEAE